MTGLLSTPVRRAAGLLVGLLVIALLAAVSVAYGALSTSWRTVIEAYTQFNGSNEHLVITEVRVPRTVIALAVGASLGMAGALLQMLTRNPLADPEVFGLNAGAALAIVVAVSVFAISSLSAFTVLAFVGAACAGVGVLLLGSLGSGGMTPLKLTLAGAAVWALCESVTSGFLTINERALDEVLFWLKGSVAGRNLERFLPVLPYMVLGWLGAIWVAGPLRALMMGEDVARGLGQRTMQVKVVTGAVIVLLAGSSVAIAGPIGFIGLVAPHAARALVGFRLRWQAVYSGLLGAILLLAADIGGRYVAMPKELPIGVMTALIGAPVFIALARRERR